MSSLLAKTVVSQPSDKIPTKLTITISPPESSIDVITRYATAVTICGRIEPAISVPLVINIINQQSSWDCQTYDFQTFYNGDYLLILRTFLSVGTYTVQVSFSGNDQYAKSSVETYINVNPNYNTIIQRLTTICIVMVMIGIVVIFYIRKKKQVRHNLSVRSRP